MTSLFNYWMTMCFSAADGGGSSTNDEKIEDLKEPALNSQEGSTSEDPPVADASSKEDSKDHRDRAEEDDGKDDRSPTWARRRIDKLTKEKWDERRARAEAESKLAALYTRLAALEDALKKGSREPEKLDEAAVETRAAQKAAEALAQMQFTNDCNAIYEKGVARFRDFEERLENYKMIGGLTPAMVQAAMATDDPALAIYRLAADPDMAHEVRSLDPVKMAARMTKLVEKQRVRPVISKAPAPIEPARGGSPSAPFDPEKVSMDQFIKWREENSRSRRGGSAG